MENLPRQPEYANLYPWGNPYKGGGLRPPPQRGAAFGRPPLWFPLYGPLHGHGFVYLGCLGRSSTFLLRLCVISPMGFPMGPGSASSNSHLVLQYGCYSPNFVWPHLVLKDPKLYQKPSGQKQKSHSYQHGEGYLTWVPLPSLYP